MLFRLKTGRFEEGNSGGESRHRCDRTTAQVKAPIIGWNNMQIESLALYVYWDAQSVLGRTKCIGTHRLILLNDYIFVVKR